MTMSLIAVLLSLAMMLTGAGGEGQPAEASRSAVLRNVSVTYNGETVRLGHEARLGAYTDGERAIVDFGVELEDETLLPVQLGAGEEGVTALFGGADVAVTVTAEALQGLTDQLNAQLDDAMAQGDNPELVSFLTDELLPAYTGLLGAATDAERYQEIQEAARAVFDERVDRGEGTPAVAEIDGEEYDATAYSYTLGGAELAALADEMYAAAPELSAYYDALFKLYAMLPEESGLNGIDSFASLFERFGVDMRIDIDEQIAEDGAIVVQDAVLTVDMSAMAEAVEEAVEEAMEEVIEEAAEETIVPEPAEEDAEETFVPEPVVMYIHSEQVGDMSEARLTCAYDVGDQGFDMDVTASRESDAQDFEATVTVRQDGKDVDRFRVAAFVARDGEGGASYSLSFRNIAQDVSKLDANFYGVQAPDGTSENSFALGYRSQDANVDVSFDLDVTADAVEDAVTGREADYVIDDLSEEGFQALIQDGDLAALLTRVGVSLAKDAAKLANDEGVKDIAALIGGDGPAFDVDDIDEEDYAAEPGDADFTYEIEGLGDDGEIAYDYEEAEDDGVLGFEPPQFTWLPSGWAVAATDIDTAYDWVELSLTDEEGEECAYAIFFPDPEEAAVNYIVRENGEVVEGREINVTDFGEGGLSVTLRENGLYGNMMFASEAIEVETLGKLIAGIEFAEE